MSASILVSVSLVCAVVAALSLGVLVAYGLCVGMFNVFRIHARQVQARRALVTASALPVARG